MYSRSRALLKRSYRFVKLEVLYGTLLYHYGVLRHRALVSASKKSQAHTYTRFYRSPGQLAALIGPVLDHVMGGDAKDKLQINVFASSNGAESYTLASTLLHHRPDIDFQITGSDLHQDMVDRAIEAVYSFEEVHYWAITDTFVSQTFDKVDGAYVVKPHIRSRVSFRQADLLDPAIANHFEPAHLVFIQNVLCHLDPRAAAQAFRSVARLLQKRSALFIDGMDLNLREVLTREAGLEPLDFQCREIHEAARTHFGERWWNYYYGVEPYATWHRDRTRRFSTIFFQDKKAQTEAADSPSTKPTAHADVVQALSAYLGQKDAGDPVGPRDSLLNRRLADSEEIVDLLGFIEREFAIEIDASDLVPRNFESLASIASLVTGRRKAQRRDAMPASPEA